MADPIYDINTIVIFVRFLLAITLTIIALRAFLVTRNYSMFYLTVGFALIMVGSLFSTLYRIEDLRTERLMSNVFDVFALIALIIAIKKS
jgi:hypothetical protein